MRITKKELKEVWDAIKNPQFGWVAHCIYIFEYKGKLHSFVEYNGQGAFIKLSRTLDIICNSKVKYKSYSIEELFCNSTNCKDVVENAKNLIESTWTW